MNPPEDMRPGQVLQPNAPQPPSQEAPAPNQPQAAAVPIPQPAPLPEPVVTTPQTQAPAAVPQEPASSVASPISPAPAEQPANWYAPAGTGETPATDEPHDLPEELSWVGAEFIGHDKNATWFMVLGLVGLVLAGTVYVFTKDVITTGIIIFSAVGFGIFAARKPREQQYALTHDGLEVGNKFYAFHEFKSFSVAEEAGVASIAFMPLKRFMPPLTIYVPQTVEKQVADFLVDFLPVEQHKADAVDSLMRRIHF